MSLADIKREVLELKVEERLELADFLAERDALSDEARRARIERRMKAMDQGRKISQDQLLAVHQALRGLGL